MKTDLAAAFRTRYVPEPNSGCWLWTGSFRHTYGQLMTTNERVKKQVYAHRLAYELFRGPIGENLCVCHRCDNPACVNPDHLFLGTQADNVRDMIAKGRKRQTRGETHPSARLTEADVKEIRRLYASGVSDWHLAKRFGIRPGAAWGITRRKKWRHI